MSDQIPIEVAYARPEKQLILSLAVPVGTTIEQAICQSGILLAFPEIDLNKQKVGVFSKPRHLHDEVFAQERIEIYRPLTRDPKDTRRLRAKNNEKI